MTPTAPRRARAVCQACGKRSKWVTPSDGRLSFWDLDDWSTAPYSSGFTHQDGTHGSKFTCPKCDALPRFKILQGQEGTEWEPTPAATWTDSWLTADEARAAVPATPQRRALNRSSLAYVIHHDGGYAVTDGESTIPAHDLADAKRITFIHNHLADHGAHLSELRINP